MERQEFKNRMASAYLQAEISSGAQYAFSCCRIQDHVCLEARRVYENVLGNGYLPITDFTREFGDLWGKTMPIKYQEDLRLTAMMLFEQSCLQYLDFYDWKVA